MAHIVSIPMTPEQFLKAQVALNSAAGVSHTGDDKSGTVHSKDIDFSYTFDGSSLAMDITARHSLKAKIASDSQIAEHVKEMLA
jgi:hypothetical protein